MKKQYYAKNPATVTGFYVCNNRTKRNIEKCVCSKSKAVSVERATRNEEIKQNEDGASRQTKARKGDFIEESTLTRAFFMVRVGRLELPASWSQTKRPTNWATPGYMPVKYNSLCDLLQVF